MLGMFVDVTASALASALVFSAFAGALPEDDDSAVAVALPMDDDSAVALPEDDDGSAVAGSQEDDAGCCSACYMLLIRFDAD